MSRVNTVGAELAERGLVRAATDITGFGLLGHLASMCRASGVSAEIFAHDVPAISEEIFELIERDCVPGGTKQNLKTAKAHSSGKRRQSAAAPPRRRPNQRRIAALRSTATIGRSASLSRRRDTCGGDRQIVPREPLISVSIMKASPQFRGAHASRVLSTASRRRTFFSAIAVREGSFLQDAEARALPR